MSSDPRNLYPHNRPRVPGPTGRVARFLALAHLLDQDGRNGARAAELATPAPIAGLPTKPRATAKSVICLFQHGGPSQMDLFDPKPMLSKMHGQKYPGQLEIHFDKQSGNLLGSPFRFRPHGQSGMVLSEVIPHLANIVDDITMVRSMTTESVDHEAALRLIHTGKILAGRPTLGAWTIYGLGSENRNLPAYVVLSDPGGLPVDGVRNWSSGWLPAIHQGTPFRSGASPVLNLQTPGGSPPPRARTSSGSSTN